jgi:DNA-binding LacI/PurR family transcriptional regulator
LAVELGVNHKTANAALTLLEREGLLISQGPGLAREIVLPQNHHPPGLRIAILDFDSQSQGVDYMIDLRRRLEAAGHLPFFTDKCLKDLGSNITRIARYVEQTRADAWIIGAGSREILEWFAKRGTPAFAMFGVRDEVPIAATGPDKGTTLAEVTRHLLTLGHRRISFIVRHEVRHPKPARGIRAYLDELEAAGITTGAFNLPDWEETREGFERLLGSFFNGPTPPTALILDEAFEFNAAYHHISQKGLRVPNDVSLVCTDYDPGFDWCEPPVAHIRWDYPPVVRRIVRWANNVAQGKDDLRQTLTKAEFVKGGTTGPARTF